MNQTTVAGHLGADPEVRFTSNGQKVTTLRVAAKARKGGKDDTIWWKVTIWGEQFDKMMVYLKKGSPVIVTGEMSKPEIFMDREGKPHRSCPRDLPVYKEWSQEPTSIRPPGGTVRQPAALVPSVSRQPEAMRRQS